jgi:TolB-like protein
VLEHLVRALPVESDELLQVLERWLELTALDTRAHELMLDALARRARIREGEDHLASAIRLFEAEGLDAAPLRTAWRASRNRHSRITVASPGVELAALETGGDGAALRAPATAMPETQRRASIAVMPLVDEMAGRDSRGGLAGALAHDVITRLAKLRSLAVIAQGTVFALGERSMTPAEAGRTLNVDYVASGWVRIAGGRVVVMMELAETRSARIIWAEDFNYALDDALLVLEEIGNRIVACIASEIEIAERNRALLKPPGSLDAWEAYHRGLWHMYRFNPTDNEEAQRFFQRAVRLDPTFSRAHAGLSFTHFQNVFVLRAANRQQEIDRAYAAAGQAVVVDDRDPAAHWAMGRALWLRGQQEESLAELDKAVDLSPNFALGHYTLAFVHSQSGDARAAIRSSDH